MTAGDFQLWTAIGVGALLLASPLSPGASRNSAPVFNLDAPIESQLAAYVNVEGRHRASGPQRIAITSFAVEFLDSREALAEPAAKKAAHKAASKKSSKEEDAPSSDDEEAEPKIAASVAITLDRSQLQSIADTLYDSAVEDLRAAGAEVVPLREPVAASAEAGIPVASASDRRESTDSSGKRTALVISAHGLPEFQDTQKRPAVEATLARQLGATVLSAHYVVDFLVLRDSDDRLFHETLTTGYQHTIRPVETWCRVTHPDGATESVALKLAVRAPQSPVGRGLALDDPDQSPDSNVERLALNTAVYYDQSLRYLGATQDLFFAALQLR